MSKQYETNFQAIPEDNKYWWKDEVIYQIYPRSFQDSNGDGIGDIQGIISRLDYIQNLGVTAIWISPIYKSPMVDMGYDITDYQQIDPVFGTMDDVDELIRKARDRGIKIIMDLVANHTSDQNEWFQKALHDPQSKYRDYYIFKHTDDGKAPNNWRGTFGGSTWTPVPGEPGTYYFHTFAAEQPDLNWENPKLRQDMYKIINWWLEKGIAGFRLDAITQLKKDLDWASLPADGRDGLVNVERKGLNRPGLGKFLRELRDETFAKYNAVTIGEAYGVKPEDLSEFVGPNGYFSMIFDFSYLNIDVADPNEWYRKNDWQVADLAHTMFSSQQSIKEANGNFANVIENHDQNRALTKFIQDPNSRTPAAAKALAAMYFFLPGVPIIYQGQELGMKNFERTSIDQFNDVSSLNNYQRALNNGYSEKEALKFVNWRSRDNARVPMQWDDSETAGFSTHKPWLNPGNHRAGINVFNEETDPKSILNFYKRILQIRQDPQYKSLFIEGNLQPLPLADKDIIGYQREYQEQKITILVNLNNQLVDLGHQFIGEVIVDSLYNHDDHQVNVDKLAPFQAVVLRSE
ncbi:alpha-glucosidase [Fructilactobacillus lindneri]|uniref:Glucohydrolase n=1 Tax=Fructilactobacillus lindneri TaxID=53444 RepID=A0AB33BQP2_9LACO|nr:alpha-glucosidase [Fructilactobacillus lindneri]ANZ57689.1 glucohydrolase [Fructilactobacillus lindneri]ANZ58959.1 glucohydrolase [Fructilactobacillus lindneri]POG99038.1 glucohydrolase [Fructilactobacillus lindneri]POH01530.1 glucohydrolase [Fructilactobacillus lindneri]